MFDLRGEGGFKSPPLEKSKFSSVMVAGCHQPYFVTNLFQEILLVKGL